MKILMVINNMRLDSGVCSAVTTLTNGLAQRGHVVYVASLSGIGMMEKRLIIPSSQIIDLSNHKNLFLKTLALHGKIKKGRFDVVHTHMHRPGIVGRLASLGTRSISVVTEHSSHLPTKGLREGFMENLTDALLARRTKTLVAVSPSVAATLAARISIPPNAIKIIQNPIDWNRFSEMKEDLRVNHSLPINLLFVGRLAFEKNVNLCIQILKKLNTRGIQVSLTIAGTGPERENLEKIVMKENLEKNVSFLGAVEDIQKLMKQSDLLLVTSYWEGCPIVILEAYQTCLPVVATRVSGIIDVVDDKITGLLFEVTDVEQGADKIEELISDSALYKKIVMSGYEKAKLFSEEIIIPKYIECYEESLKENANKI